MAAYVSSLDAGNVYTLVQNTIYGLPPVKVTLLADTALELAIVNDTTKFTLVAASTTGLDTVAQFVRCTTANAKVSVKRA